MRQEQAEFIAMEVIKRCVEKSELFTLEEKEAMILARRKFEDNGKVEQAPEPVGGDKKSDSIKAGNK